jgi:hypothetical protein
MCHFLPTVSFWAGVERMPYKPKAIVESEANALAISHLDALLAKIDRSAAIDHAITAVDCSTIERQPFPYVILKSVFDETTHDALLELVTLDDLFYTEEGGTAYTILRYPQTNYNVSASIQAFIEFMAEDLMPAVLDALRRKFAADFLIWADYLIRHRLYNTPAKAMLTTKICPELHPYETAHSLHDGMTSQFEIMRRTDDFEISPHCHPVRELLIGLFPIVPDNSLTDYGTDLFAVKDGSTPTIDLTEFSYVSPDVLKPAGRTKFLRNSAFVMLNTAGVHAYKPPPQPRPRSYLYATLMIGANALGAG